MHVSEVARYWKDDALFKCDFTTPLPKLHDGEGVREAVLNLAGKVAPIWQVGAVGSDHEFWGAANERIVVSGVDSLLFAVGSQAERD